MCQGNDCQGTNSDYLATELLSEIKRSNERWFKIAFAMLLAWLVTIGVFVWYLNQYDFSSTTTETNEATGVYAIVDSDGNVIASDLQSADVAQLLKGLNDGNRTKNQNSNQVED